MNVTTVNLTLGFLFLSLIASAGSVHTMPLNPRHSSRRLFLSGFLLGMSGALFLVALLVVYLGICLV